MRAPRTFSGSLDELFAKFIEPNLPDVGTVEAFHAAFVDYLATPDPLHLLRQSRGMERRETYRTAGGTRFKATDNAPAWWTQYALLQGCRIAPDKFGQVVETMPAHMFDVARTLPASASAAGWHIAHVFNVKDRRTDYENWSRREVAARFVRNIHPCNHFLLPKTDWRRWGGDERVLTFFGDVYADRYATVWCDFVRLARVRPDSLARVAGPVHYQINADTAASDAAPGPPARRRGRPPIAVARRGTERHVTYEATRLAFKARLIEPLADDESFRIVTPVGTFEMTKRQFYEAFPRVVVSASYRDGGLYHFPTVPRAALSFLVDQKR